MSCPASNARTIHAFAACHSVLRVQAPQSRSLTLQRQMGPGHVQVPQVHAAMSTACALRTRSGYAPSGVRQQARPTQMSPLSISTTSKQAHGHAHTRSHSRCLATDASRPYASARSLPSLPSASSRLLWAIGIGTAVLSSWTLFTAHATNRERLSSSVLRAALDQAKENEELRRKLGVTRLGQENGRQGAGAEMDAELGDVRLVRSSWLLGDAWVGGSINMMQGRIDIDFRVKGPSEDTATIHFKSHRPLQQRFFVIDRFDAVLDKTGEVVPLNSRAGGGSKHITAGI